MAATREIVTLQFGHFSNFVGAHFWNIQESLFNYDVDQLSPKSEVNNDCLFRVGKTQNNDETYTPRMLAFDLKGSLRNFNTEGDVYSASNQAIEWEGELSVYKSNVEPKNEFQIDIEEDQVIANSTKDASNESDSRSKWYHLDDRVDVWSDFVGTQYHPKSVNIIKEYSHEADHFAFDMFGYGQSLYKDDDFRDEFENSLHFFVEECDQLQGFQIFSDVHNGFAGLASQVLEDLADEYSTKSLITYGFLPGYFPGNTDTKSAQRLLNMALSYRLISENSSMFTPMSMARQGWFHTGSPALFPYLNYTIDLLYHTSAILASTVDTLTMPYRLDTPLKCHMNDIANSITFGERKITSVSSSFPLPISTNSPLDKLFNSYLHKKESVFVVPLTPNVSQIKNCTSQVAILRGACSSASPKQSGTLQQPIKKPKTSIDSCQSSLEMLNVFKQAMSPLGVNSNWVINQASRVTPPYPNIFASSVTSDGFVEEGYRRNDRETVKDVSMLACAATSSGVGQMLHSLVKNAQKADIRKHSCFVDSGVELSAFVEVLEGLESMASNYDTSSSLL